MRASQIVLAAALVAAALLSAVIMFQVGSAIRQRAGEELVYDRLGGILVDHAVRVRTGQPLYQAPDEHFAPVIYTPLYYYLAAFLMLFVSDAVIAARLTSLLLIAGSATALMVLARRLTGTLWAPAAVVPLICAGYPLCEFLYDAPRVDPAAAFWVVVSVVLAYFVRGVPGGVVIGLCLALGFWSKQSAAFFAVAFCGVLLLDNLRRGLAATVTCGVAIAGSVAAVSGLTNGWFWNIGVVLTSKHHLRFSRMAKTLAEDWAGPLLLPLLALVLLAGLLYWKWEGNTDDLRLRLLLLSTSAVAVMTTVSRTRGGGSQKTLMPVVFLLAATLPIAFWWLGKRFAGDRQALVRAGAAVCFSLIVASALFSPAEAVAEPKAVEQWQRLKGEIERYAARGQVWAPLWGHLTTPMEGQAMRPCIMPLNDFLGSDYPVPPGLEKMIVERQFSAIFFPNDPHIWAKRSLLPLVQKEYRQIEELWVRIRLDRRLMPIGVYVPRRRAEPWNPEEARRAPGQIDGTESETDAR